MRLNWNKLRELAFNKLQALLYPFHFFLSRITPFVNQRYNQIENCDVLAWKRKFPQKFRSFRLLTFLFFLASKKVLSFLLSHFLPHVSRIEIISTEYSCNAIFHNISLIFYILMNTLWIFTCFVETNSNVWLIRWKYIVNNYSLLFKIDIVNYLKYLYK